MEGMNMLPMWVEVFIGIATALGGWEAIKYLLSLRANRRKDKAEAVQEEMTAAQQQAELVRHQLETSAQMLEQMKAQNTYFAEQVKAYEADKEEDRKLKRELRLTVAEHERKIDGLQRAFNESETRRRAAERLFCSVEECPQRVPPLGTYNGGDIPPRKSNGQFAKRNKTNGQILHS